MLDLASNKQKVKNNLFKYGLIGFVAILIIATILGSYTKVGSGDVVRVQNNVSGKPTWYTTEGYKLKMPFVSSSVTYPQEITIGVSDNKEICETASACSAPRNVTFVDTYNMTLETVTRFSLPKSPELLEKMHDKVKSKDNLVGTVLLPFAQDLIGYTSSQYQAEYFLQGQQNDFRNRLIDQAENGLIQTKRIKKLVTTEVANQGVAERDSNKPLSGEQYKFEVEPVLDKDGKYVRSTTSISEYGITLVPSGISLVEYIPSPELASFMADKQKRVRARAGIIEDQENERQRAITIDLKGNADRIEQQNQLVIAKDRATIAAQQQVEVAELQAKKEIIEREKVENLATIDKRRELKIAQDNLAIEEANSKAAKFAAMATKEKGLAEAAVTMAKYKAIDKGVLQLEVSRDVAKALYSSNINVQMPQYVGGSSIGGMESIEAMSSLKVMEMLAPKAVIMNK